MTSRQTGIPCSPCFLLEPVVAQVLLLLQQSSFVVRWLLWHSCEALSLAQVRSTEAYALTILQRQYPLQTAFDQQQRYWFEAQSVTKVQLLHLRSWQTALIVHKYKML